MTPDRASPSRVLVVDDEAGVRDLLGDILGDAGFEVIQAENGSEALSQAWRDCPDVVVLDVIMPNMDGLEVLQKLRHCPTTRDLPVVLLTALPPEKGECRSMRLGVSHYVPKPWSSGTVELAVRSALRDAAERAGTPPLSTGEAPLDRLLGGGLPLGSLALIEGTSPGAGALTHHLVRGGLDLGYDVVYYSEHLSHSLVARMDSSGLGISGHARRDALCFRAISQGPAETAGTLEGLASRIAEDVAASTSHARIVTVDAITRAATAEDDRSVLAFFARCRELCELGTTVLLACHPAGFTGHLLHRLRDMCDFYLRLGTESRGDIPTEVLEALKVRGVETRKDNRVSLRVDEGGGIRVLPATRMLRV